MAEPVPVWREIEQKEAALSKLQSVSAPLSPATTTKLQELATRLLLSLKASGAAIAHELPGNATLMICVISCGNTAPALGAILDANSGISGRCIREDRTLHSYDTSLDPRVDGEACNRLGIRSLAIAPLRRNSRCFGVVEVFSERAGNFDSRSLLKLEEEALIAAELIGSEDSEPAEFPGHSKQDRISVIAEDHPEEAAPPPPSASGEPAETQPLPELEIPGSLNTSAGAPPRRFRSGRWLAVAAAAGLASVGLALIIYFPRVTSARAAANSHSAKPPALAHTSVPPNVSPDAPVVESIGVASVQELAVRAESGDPKAQFALASHYSNGDGIGKDRVKAASWYILASSNGDQQAKLAAVEITHELQPFQIAQVRFNVGKMFMDGVGVPADLISAYSWFELAKAAGDIRAKPELEKLSREMTAEQISKAHIHTQTWLSSHRVRGNSPNAVLADR